MYTSGFLKAVYLGDVRVVQRRQGLGLALKTGQTFGILGELGWKDLDRNLSVQVGVGGLVDLTYFPFTEWAGDLVGTELCACCEGHRVAALLR